MKGGIAVITVPNDFSITQQAALNQGYIDYKFWVVLPDHLSYFDHISLPATAAKTGWTYLDMIGDFPIDWFLFNENTNYIKNTALGKSSHNARVQIENLIHSQGSNLASNFYSGLAKLGMGRNLTIFLGLDQQT